MNTIKKQVPIHFLERCKQKTLAFRHSELKKICTTDKEKADTLNEQFLSVFTHERNMNIPDKGQSMSPDIPDLNISTAGVNFFL